MVNQQDALRAAWLRPKQADLVPGKGQFRSCFPHRLSYGCPTTIFLDLRNRHRHHLRATLLDGRAGNGWARLLRCGRDRSGGGFPNAGYELHPSCGDCPLTAGLGFSELVDRIIATDLAEVRRCVESRHAYVHKIAA